jgi:regulator of nonsense transcripts 2
LEKVFSKPHKVKFGNIHLLGILLSALYRYHPEFVVRVIDRLLESIAFGLEQNEFRFYQRRIAEVKYLGELYNYRMLEHPVVFETLHKITSFGYGMFFSLPSSLPTLIPFFCSVAGGIPVPDKLNPFDPPDDFFRIRLVGTLLDTCGMFFNRGAAGKKLDYFMSFFQVRKPQTIL